MKYPNVRLGEVVELRSGIGFPLSFQGRSTGAYPFVKVGDISRVARMGGRILDTANHLVTASDVRDLRASLFPPGTVAFAKIGEAIRQNFRVVAAVPMLLDNNAMGAIPSEAVDSTYLYHFLATVEMFRFSQSTTVPSLRKSALQRIEIPLPSIEEQRRITAVLDAADALRTKRRQALAKLDTLTQAIFIDMFGDPIRNDRGWALKPFEKLCRTHLGKMLDAKQQSGHEARVYLRNANVRWFRFDLSDISEMDFNTEDRARYALKKGDVLICEGGEPGRAAVWEGEIEECYFQKALHRGRPNADLATAEFLVHLLRGLSERGGLVDHISTATISHLTGQRLKSMAVIAPPIEFQKEFTRRVHVVKRQRMLVSGSANETDDLFAALQQRAFSGEL